MLGSFTSQKSSGSWDCRTHTCFVILMLIKFTWNVGLPLQIFWGGGGVLVEFFFFFYVELSKICSNRTELWKVASQVAFIKCIWRVRRRWLYLHAQTSIHTWLFLCLCKLVSAYKAICFHLLAPMFTLTVNAKFNLWKFNPSGEHPMTGFSWGSWIRRENCYFNYSDL